MKVLHFFKTYWPDTFGGIERTIHAICTGACLASGFGRAARQRYLDLFQVEQMTNHYTDLFREPLTRKIE